MARRDVRTIAPMSDADHLTWNAPDSDHPGRLAARRSLAAVAAGDIEAWLAVYTPDALVEDPVGPSMFDP